MNCVTCSFFLLPHATTLCTGTVLGKYCKDISQDTNSKRFRTVASKKVPADITAGGFRPGALNSMLSAMPYELAAQCSGDPSILTRL